MTYFGNSQVKRIQYGSNPVLSAYNGTRCFWTAEPGNLDWVCSFSAQQQSYVTIADVFQIEPEYSAMAAWIKPSENYGTTGYDYLNVIGNIGRNTTSSGQMMLYVNMSATASQRGVGVFWKDDNGTQHELFYAIPDLAGKWHMVVASHEGTEMKLYLDGSMVKSQDTGRPMQSTEGQIKIGRDAFASGRYFEGQIAECAVFAYNLEASDIASKWSSKTRFTGSEDYCVGLWHMDDNSSSIMDSSPEGHNGSLANGSWQQAEVPFNS